MTLKIGIVCPYDYCFPGGVVQHISYLAHHFLRMGHPVKVIAPCSRRGVSYFGEEVIPIGRPWPWPNSGSIARIPVTPWLGLQVRRVLDAEQFDILHIHEPYTPMLAWSALNESHSPIVATFHAYHTKARGYWIGKPILLRIQKKLQRKIAVSGPALVFVSRHLPSDYVIIPNGVDTERFCCGARPRPDLSDGKLNILFVGRLEKRKGVPYLLSAFAEVKKELPQARLILAGPGKLLRAEYEKTVEEKGLDDVQFPGFVPDAELPGYYRSAHVFCAPATHGESFGIVLLEAMASGVPVVASDIDGYNSVVVDGQDGLLVPPRNPESLARTLVAILKDGPLRQQLSRAGVAKAQQHSWANIAHRVMNCYLEAQDEFRMRQGERPA